jgi:hypothetical protein
MRPRATLCAAVLTKGRETVHPFFYMLLAYAACCGVVSAALAPAMHISRTPDDWREVMDERDA